MVSCLIALTIFDSIQLFLSVPILVLPAAKQYLEIAGLNSKDNWGVGLAEFLVSFFIRFTYPLLMAANCGSIWTIIIICVQRYFAICHPIRSRSSWWLRQGSISVVLVTILAFAFNFIRYSDRFCLVSVALPSFDKFDDKA